MKKFAEYILGVLVLFLFIFLAPTSTLAATLPADILGTAASFSALASSSMDCTDAGAGCSVFGYYGLSSGTSTQATGSWHMGTGYFSDSPDPTVSSNAMASSSAAYAILAGQTPSASWSGSGSTTPAAGIWKSSDATTTFNGTLTLDAHGDYNATWIFQIGGDFNFTGSVVMLNGAQPCHVFWQVGGAANITENGGESENAIFIGTLIASGNIHFISAGKISGRLISLNGSLSMNKSTTSAFLRPACATCGLKLYKILDNTNTGTSVITDWVLQAIGTGDSPTNLWGYSPDNLLGYTPADSDSAFSYYSTPFKPDTYTLTEENDGPTGYTASPWSCVGGTQNSSSTITVASGDNIICTITNADTPLLTLNNTINGGTASASDWTLSASGITSISGSTGDSAITRAPVKIGTYTLSESTSPANYTASSWSCAINGGTPVTGNTIGLVLGDAAICIVTNTYSASIIPTPTPNPHPPGRVLPQIKVTKTANPQTLPASGGMVTYTENITNPGFYAIGNIKIVDDKCAPLKYISGDTNLNSWLDTNETWAYSCRTKIIETTTNTATAEGSAYNMTARDSATATVVVVPKLPNTGFAPKTSAFYRSLSIGAQGVDVAALQTALEQKYLLTIPSGVAKGYFGSLTRKAVTKYQAGVNLPTVGIFGPLTRAKLTSELGE